MTDFKQIEDLIITTLKEKLPYLDTVQTVEGDDVIEIEKKNHKYPAALVLYSGSSFNEVDNDTLHEAPRYTVFCATRSNRGVKQAKKGAGGGTEKGVYDVILDVTNALTNEVFGMNELFKFIPVRVEPVLIAERLSVYGIEFNTGFDTDYEIS